MAQRITRKFLESQCERINDLKGAPQDTYGPKDEGGRYPAQMGNYHISGAYGGYSLHRISSAGGGVDDVFRCGHETARNLADRISAYLTALYEIEQGQRDARQDPESGKCPGCGSEQIEGHSYDQDTGRVWQKMTCTECDAEWVNCFQYDGRLHENNGETLGDK